MYIICNFSGLSCGFNHVQLLNPLHAWPEPCWEDIRDGSYPTPLTEKLVTLESFSSATPSGPSANGCFSLAMYIGSWGHGLCGVFGGMRGIARTFAIWGDICHEVLEKSGAAQSGLGYDDPQDTRQGCDTLEVSQESEFPKS